MIWLQHSFGNGCQWKLFDVDLRKERIAQKKRIKVSCTWLKFLKRVEDRDVPEQGICYVLNYYLERTYPKKKKLKAKCAMYFDKFQLCNVDGYGIRGSRTGLSQSLFMGSGIYLIDKWV